MIRNYYKIKFTLKEPLSLGSGETKHSDRDVLVNSHGEPLIPGSSLAGLYRDLFRDLYGDATSEKYFGKLFDKDKAKNGEEQHLDESKVIVYDATLLSEPEVDNSKKRFTISVRDGVGLDDYKTAKDGAKFDFEIVEPGAVFVTYLEQIYDPKKEKDEKYLDVGEVIAKAYKDGQIYFGHKTMRGYGRIGAVHIWERSFTLPEPGDDPMETDLDQWLEFNMYEAGSFPDKEFSVSEIEGTQDISCAAKGDSCKMCVIKLGLKLRDGISVRQYTTDLSDNPNEEAPDYMQLYYKKDKGVEVPCIPGTTWAGAFRHHIKQLLPEKKDRDEIIDEYFGYSKEKEKIKQKSKVRFSESQVEQIDNQTEEWKTITRNAIDRFTGGTIGGALYTEKTFFGGTTDLTITYPQNALDNNKDWLWKCALAAAITDLDQGFLAVGGLTAVGRGLFEVEQCSYNGSEIYNRNKAEDMKKNGAPNKLGPVLYSNLLEAMKVNDQKEAEA